MALNCEEKLAADIIKDCDNKPVGGLEVSAVLINLDDIDKVATTFDATNDLIITNLATKSATTGYLLEGIKQTNGASWEFVEKEDTFDGYKHLFAGVILTPSAANKKLMAQLASGGRYVVVVEKKFKGALSVDAFEVLGYNAGLKVKTAIWNSKESDGVIKFELASDDGYEEPEMTRNLLETDYDTTATAFTGKFATV